MTHQQIDPEKDPHNKLMTEKYGDDVATPNVDFK
eukprot:CAMPEP_0168327836 /NCGR_PEP_ID=MMETSP0213-20121227/6117_1 /TAXON_ID=151035 /ORGANISM="Euplotes harpa, Strain FSP1.4" /LENGTH=33 /DNA_ID= /DNA_START= /DNA_END= /DNA_ORIENTATION=